MKKQNKKSETTTTETPIEIESIETTTEEKHTSDEWNEIAAKKIEEILNQDPLYFLNKTRDTMNKIMNHCQTKLALINNAINIHSAFIQNRQDEIDNARIQQVIDVNQSIGNILTVEQVKIMLGIKPIAAQTITAKVTDSMDIDLINRTIIQYHCSYGKLPIAVKAQFNEASKSRYSAIQSYYQTIQSKGSIGTSYYSALVSSGLDYSNLSHKQFPLQIGIFNRPESASTTTRFLDADKLYKSTLTA